MEDQLIAQLQDIAHASSEAGSQAKRQQAEIALQHARGNPAFPTALINVGSHASIDIAVRSLAMTTLNKFIQRNWAQDEDTDEPLIEIPDATREVLRNALLELALNNEDNRKIKALTSYSVGKIAAYDYPERWPNLLTTLFTVVPGGSDAQIYGGLKILSDVIDESLSEDQFFSMAREIVKAVTQVAFDENRRPNLRALAISIFRGCFDLMDIVKDDHPVEVKAFADEALKEWLPYFLQVLKVPLPESSPPNPADLRQPEAWNSVVSIKIQVVKTLLKVKTVFPNLLTPHSTALFSAVWSELQNLQGPYEELYVNNGAQGRMEDADAIPFTLDFLVVEELDFLNQCFRAPPVIAELARQLEQHASGQEVPWMVDIIKMLVSYSRIGSEELEMWEIDCSLYLVEETSASTNYTARIASSDLLIKLGEWYNHKIIDALFAYTKTLFGPEKTSWGTQEAALFLFSMLLSDFHDMDKSIPDQITQAYLSLVDYTINQSEAPFLRARGYLLGGNLTRAVPTPPALLDRTIACITSETEEVVQLSCVKALEYFMRSNRVQADRQIPILAALSQYMQNKDPEELEVYEELVVTLTETIRLAIHLNPRVVIQAPDVQSVDLLFAITKHAASNFHAVMIVNESFGDIVRSLSDSASYAALCARVLPTLTAAFNTATVTENDPLVTTAAELLTSLVEHGSEPLPAGFVAATLPKLNKLLMESNEGEVLRPGAEAVKYLLMHDHHQVFAWQEDGKSGLEVCLRIIDRLLTPSIEDNSASEVGGLAAELVEKAGNERLGPFLPQLLQAVATRLATAEAAPFIQSLILVFARLSLVGAHDVVEFLGQIQINNESGLQVVMSKWLENSINFAGYDEIRQNVIALSKLYSLNDPRLSQVMVKGDLVPNTINDGKIMTRSRARANPDRYTVIPATLKIIKVLIEELLSASGVTAASSTAAAAATAAAQLDDADKDDDGWEDDDTLDLSLGTTKEDLMTFIDFGGTRQRDDETQAYLTEFFIRAARENVANFQEWYGMLNEEEKEKLNELA
ncbi:ARM repeat-containing protein [Sodiomyces alkalinus F11]|uniref:ARM repeat-containing protein n=1 Tax=Sodiomyces alkalinus (strain CBS 110278 / VKM F-3762 / F11) TaxID=1314773 RepID=A0A3N2Q835_SODAK|nr:ARM repeat-containing protein [Sodiomyces alkalinus F11]ROT42912.1 ARM repeat-containing protein [Sodiomyces alkalinus F11]